MSTVDWTAGHSYRSFYVERSIALPELHMHLLELIHKPTGARIMHIIHPEDPENVFCLSFQTRPTTSNGVAHILEHTVLCGSDKYPVRDPFFSMTRRSLNTYMNAMTSSDCTFYPAASQVPTDFYNLFDIYLDAVFHPKLELGSFQQEGHRLEFTSPEDAATPLVYKGIVYNEMKGAMAAPMSRLFEHMNALLYPGSTYGVNSGGLPSEILKLTHEELCAFHTTHYHPSRCLFYFYGNLATERHLDYLADRLLDKVTPVAPLPSLPPQPRYNEPRHTAFSYPSEPTDTPEANTIVAMSWLTCSIQEQETLLALSLLSLILMDTDASPLKRALLDSKLCKQAVLYIDSDNWEVPVYLVCKGCNAVDAAALESLILTTLRRIVTEGIDSTALDSALHQLELHRSEITGNGTPYGLTLFGRAALLRQHGVAPEQGLLIHTLFESLRHHLHTDKRYLEKLLERYLIDNGHRVVTVMTPDPTLTEQEKAAESADLQERTAALTTADKENLVTTAATFQAFQQQQEDQDTAVLPILQLEDIPRQSRDYPLANYADGPLQIFHHGCFTNQIVYIDYSLPLSNLTEEELPYIHLLTALTGQLGCGGRSFSATLDYIQAYTGGVDAIASLHYHTRYLDRLSPQLSLRGKALHRNVDKVCSLLVDMAAGSDLSDRPRLKELVLKHWSGLQSTFTQSAMRYASNLASSTLSTAGRIGYAWHGLEYYYTLKKIAENIDTSLDPLIDKLTNLQSRLLHGCGAHLILSCDEGMFQQLQDHDYYGLATIPQRSYEPWRGGYAPISTAPRQGRSISAPVASVCQMLRGVAYSDPDGAALRLSTYLMDNLCLHQRIREQGGAYGGGSSCNLMAGTFSFYSYRDPHISSTLQAFQAAVEQIAAADFDDEELFEAKLEMFQGFDIPIAPGSRADIAYSWWCEAKPFALRQAFRDRVFALTKQDVANAVARHIAPKLPNSQVVVFASQEMLERENNHLTTPLQILPI